MKPKNSITIKDLSERISILERELSLLKCTIVSLQAQRAQYPSNPELPQYPNAPYITWTCDTAKDLAHGPIQIPYRDGSGMIQM